MATLWRVKIRNIIIFVMGLLIIGCNSAWGQPDNSSMRLNKEELQTFYTNKTLIVVHHKRGPGKSYFGADGSIHNISKNGTERTGKWWIDSDMRCIKWNHKKKTFCHDTVKNADGTHTLIHSGNGKKLVEIKEAKEGNQL